jgi:hypothetical protein
MCQFTAVLLFLQVYFYFLPRSHRFRTWWQDAFISAEMLIVGTCKIRYFSAENPCPNLNPNFLLCNELLLLARR